MSETFTLSANARALSFSMSDALAVFVSGQKKILIPEGESGSNQKNSQFHKLFAKEVLRVSQSLALYLIFLCSFIHGIVNF